jgi:hypothetical protein
MSCIVDELIIIVLRAAVPAFQCVQHAISHQQPGWACLQQHIVSHDWKSRYVLTTLGEISLCYLGDLIRRRFPLMGLPSISTHDPAWAGALIKVKEILLTRELQGVVTTGKAILSGHCAAHWDLGFHPRFQGRNALPAASFPILWILMNHHKASFICCRCRLLIRRFVMWLSNFSWVLFRTGF